MMMSDAELMAFIRRMREAARRGYGVARSGLYLTVLSQEAGMAGYTESASDLATLAQAVADKRAGVTPEPPPSEEVPEKSNAPAPEPVSAESPVLEPPPELVPAEPDPEEPPVSEPVASEPPESDVPESEEEDKYSSWTRDELYEEAKARNIEHRSEMNKAELIEALKASDATEV